MSEHLARLILEAQPCVVLTGAGVSTESGIPDFQSLWRHYDPMEYATIDAFRRDPVKVWDFYSKRLGVLAEARPNAAHLALAELEQRGLVQAVVTQNVDRLHQAAGSRRVIEVHGSICSASCLACGQKYSLGDRIVPVTKAVSPEPVVELLPVPEAGGLPGRGSSGEHAAGGRAARDRQPRPDGVRPAGRPEDRRLGRRDARRRRVSRSGDRCETIEA